ncbi:ABC transporter substrate-binding protein [Thermomonospora umbrina]|uniref:NitT/TauT family transport system substrate-binding protein n=1 Tax=Thermomonospora umbrina TaxID=111806 RepID=A0A3D9SGW9_9ACTN|nr:ABC transporter substrate-binding protein [Thermomonospora umbrina]REE95146.1 NitT/TauT family transport system substrate-binding protein [Thermomonospora umbrina]
MRQSGRRFALLGGLLPVGSLTVARGDSDADSAGGNGLEKETVSVAVLPPADGAAVHVGIGQRYFEAEGLKIRLKPVQQSPPALPALVKDVIAGADHVSFLQAHDQGTLKLRVLNEAATLTPDMMNVVVMPNSPIRTAKDLEGKKVAVNVPDNIQSLTLDAILKADNLDASKIKYVAVPMPQTGAALQKGRIDAVHVAEPFLSDVQKTLGARVVVNGGGEPVTQTPISAYPTTQGFTDRYPRTAAGDRKKVEEVLPGHARIDPRVASVITLPDFPTSNNVTRLQRIVDLMTAAGLLRSQPDLNAIVYRAPRPDRPGAPAGSMMFR